MRLIDADALKEPLTDEYKKLNDVFNETSVFKAPNDVALYGALMQIELYKKHVEAEKEDNG